MRLTLRTMLAYLDDLLEPADAEQIGEKIRESESATNLASRICDVTRRLRLGSPKVSGRGGGMNPNSVAEYLDNTLSPERVPEFEKSCLESDMQLAEVAACHQVLTLVLGEPAEVTPDSRQRMYKLLGSRRAAVEDGHGSKDDNGKHEDKKKRKRRKRQEVPEYLREAEETAPSRWPLWIGLPLAAMIVVAALIALNQIAPQTTDEAQQLAQAPTKPEGDAAATKGADENMPADATPPSPDESATAAGDKPAETAKVASGESAAPDATATAANATATATAPTADAAAPPTLDEGPPVPPTDESTAVADETKPGTDATADVASAEPATGGEAPQPEAKLAQPNSITGLFRPSEPNTKPQPVDDFPLLDENYNPIDEEHKEASDEAAKAAIATTGPAATKSSADTVLAPSPADEKTADKPADTSSDVPVANAANGAAAGVGRFIPNNSVLLRHNASEFTWERVTNILHPGDDLLSLPAFRPFLTFSDVTVQLVGATHVRVLPADADGTVGLAPDYGRLVLMSSGTAGSSIRLQLGDDQFTLTFDDADATAAVEVVPHLDPGTNPADATQARSAHLYIASGTVTLTNAAGETETHHAPAQIALTTLNAGEAAAGDEMPDWIFSDSYVKSLDREAAQYIKETLDAGDAPLLKVLKETAEHRRVEYRSLAARQLSYLDDFDAVVSALNDERQRASWPLHFDALRNAVARSQGTSQKVLLALEKQYPKEAIDIHRMLWGFTKDQLTNGYAAQLVSYLDNDELPVRVLAFLNLEEITGKSRGYQPQHNALRRRRTIASWRQAYEDGEIVPLEKPTPAKD